jgi:hypothetical protein
MNARPVTQAGSRRPDRKVQARRDLASGDEADTEDEDEVDRDKYVVEPAEIEAEHIFCRQCRGGRGHQLLHRRQHKFGQKQPETNSPDPAN